MGWPLQWQHEAAEPQTAVPHCVPGSFWQEPLTTQVYSVGQLPQDPPQASSPQVFWPQNGVQVQRPSKVHDAPGCVQVPQEPPHWSGPHCLPAHWGAHVGRASDVVGASCPESAKGADPSFGGATASGAAPPSWSPPSSSPEGASLGSTDPSPLPAIASGADPAAGREGNAQGGENQRLFSNRKHACTP
jgi:hypothetical protein